VNVGYVGDRTDAVKIPDHADPASFIDPRNRRTTARPPQVL
jgi:hypothetical protein